jgi:hypothetical protein
MTKIKQIQEVRPRKDKRGVDLISDVLPFGRLRYGEPNAVAQLAKVAYGDADEAVTHEACVKVKSRDCPPWIDAFGNGYKGAWGTESRYSAIGTPREAVNHEAYVRVESRYRPHRVDATGGCAIDRAWDIKCRELVDSPIMAI